MYIQSSRLGFATNSSSTHSIILLDSTVDKNTIEDDYCPSEFGWDSFTCSSQASIINYLESSLLACLKRLYGDSVGELIGESLCKSITNVEHSYVDHQSELSFPCDYQSIYNKEPEIDLHFYECFKEYLLKYNCIILGGNDNTEAIHPLSGLKGTQFNSIPIEEESKVWLSRYDETYNFFTLFNTYNGTKIRLTFDPSVNIIRSEYPELVDIHITDKCNSGCAFCVLPETLIKTNIGNVQIKDIKIGDTVISYDVESKTPVNNKVEQTFERDFEGDLIIIELENGEILKLTPNHQIFTSNRGWINSNLLNINDNIIYLDV